MRIVRNYVRLYNTAGFSRRYFLSATTIVVKKRKYDKSNAKKMRKPFGLQEGLWLKFLFLLIFSHLDHFRNRFIKDMKKNGHYHLIGIVDFVFMIYIMY